MKQFDDLTKDLKACKSNIYNFSKKDREKYIKEIHENIERDLKLNELKFLRIFDKKLDF